MAEIRSISVTCIVRMQTVYVRGTKATRSIDEVEMLVKEVLELLDK